MARSHICTGCGNELSGLRAPPDPVYGLTLVVCPRCKRPCVRTRASVERAYRRSMRTVHSWSMLLMQGVFLVLFVTAITLPYRRAEELILREWDLGWNDAIRAISAGTLSVDADQPGAISLLAVPLGVFVMSAVGLGAWLRFGFAHWRQPLPYAIWIVVVFVCLTVPPLIELAHSQFVPRMMPIEGLGADERLGRLVASCASAAIAVAGAPLGRSVEHIWTRQLARVQARRRRQLRELRRSTA